MIKYMHTLDGFPAHYYPGQQICFSVKTRPVPLCSTLKQIKKERKASAEWRMAQGFLAEPICYGWQKVEV